MLDELNRSLFLLLNADSDAPWIYIQSASFFSEAPQFILAMILAVTWLRDPSRTWPVMVGISATIALAMVLSKITGMIYPVDRPFVVGLGNQWLAHDTDPSFPSDHAALLFSIWGACVCRAGWRAIGWTALLLGFVNGWARIGVGLHYPLDIMASLLLGLICGLAVRWFAAIILKGEGPLRLRELWKRRPQGGSSSWSKS